MAGEIDPMVAIEAELQGERASALGEAGRRIEKALAALDDTEDALEELSTAVWYYMIVRETLSMFDHKEVLAVYGVPDYVMSRVGAIKRRTA